MHSAQQAPQCVFCRQKPVVPAWRPFCSDRCKTRDLANWADQSYRIPSQSLDDAAPDIDSDGSDDPHSSF
ncbi:MAG: DNA gyrase inhibitor YacG [Vicinamibacterales bacterium]